MYKNDNLRLRVYRNLWGSLACIFGLLTLTACNVLPSASAAPVDVVFDTPQETVEGGIRLAPAESQWDGYGEVIDVRGEVMVIGASEWNQCGAGSAYVYRLSGGEWRQEVQLTARDREAFNTQAQPFETMRFGTAVALGENLIAVGAPGNVPVEEGGLPGAVYIYEYNGQTWAETAKLTPDGNLDGTPARLTPSICTRFRPSSFGSLLALEGDTLAVGGEADGAVSIYQRRENGWQAQAQVQIPALPGREMYLASMSLLGDTLALSAFYSASQESSPYPPILQGNVIVYVLEQANNTWEERFQFAPEGATDVLILPEVNLGASVSLGGTSGTAERLAIGLPGFPDWRNAEDSGWLFGDDPEQIPELPASNRQTGAVYLFERTGNGPWNQTATLKPAGWETPPGMGSMNPPGLTHTDESLSEEALESAFASFVFPGDLYSERPEVSFFGATVDLDGNQLAVTSGFANATYVFEHRGKDWVYKFGIKPAPEGQLGWEDYAQVVKLSGSMLLLGTPGEFGNSAYVFDLQR